MRELVLLIRINDAREQINGGFCKKLLALIDGGKLDLWQCGINDVVKAVIAESELANVADIRPIVNIVTKNAGMESNVAIAGNSMSVLAGMAKPV